MITCERKMAEEREREITSVGKDREREITSERKRERMKRERERKRDNECGKDIRSERKTYKE